MMKKSRLNFAGFRRVWLRAQQQERQARLQTQVVDTQIQQAQLTLEQSQDDQQGRTFQAQSTVAATEAQLKQSQAQLKLARVDRDRFTQLAKDGATPRQRFDQAQTAYETAQAVVEASQKQVEAARGGLALAKTSSFNPGIRNAQLLGLLQQRKQANSQIQVAQQRSKTRSPPFSKFRHKLPISMWLARSMGS